MCSCYKMQNLFTKGIEDVSLQFSHELEVSNPVITKAMQKTDFVPVNVESVLQTCDSYGNNCKEVARIGKVTLPVLRLPSFSSSILKP